MSILDQLKKIQLDMLIEIDKICQHNNIKYTLSSGTLLGAVRHKGFIPWDDDIDIAMTFDNYNKFISIAQQQLPQHLFLENYKTEKDCTFLFSKVVNTNTTFIDSMYKYLDTAKGVGLDIFPIYPIKKVDKDKVNKLANKVKLFISKYYNKDDIKNSFKHKLYNFFTPKFSLRSLQKYYFKKLVKFSQKGQEITKADYINGLTCNYDVFADYTYLEFEGHKFMSIAKYDEYLRAGYNDYMQLPPEEERQPHHNFIYFNGDLPYKEYLKNNPIKK